MSNSWSDYMDLITMDGASVSSTVDTNPFRNGIANSIEISSSDGAVGNSGVRNSGVETFENKMDSLISSLSKLGSRDEFGQCGRDIRHIDVFNGEGSELNVISKLRTLLADFDDFFSNRSLDDRDKLALVKQKLSGSAKSLVNSSRPHGYTELRDLLNENFGNVHMGQDELLAELKNLRVRERESFRQFCIRAMELADTIAYKLECGVSDKIIFDPFSKALLSKFEPFVTVQSQVKMSIKNRLPKNLVNELCELLETDSRIYIGSDKKGAKVNKVINVIESKGTDQPICGHCFRAGHVVSGCNFLKNKNFYDNDRSQYFR